MHVVIEFIYPLLYRVILPAYSMCWPVPGCNVSCCRLFRRGVRFARLFSCTQLCRWSWWTHFLFQAFRCYLIQMALSHIYCNKFSLETIDVISVWLLLCYKSIQVLCVSALPIQGWHLCTEIWPFEVGSLQDGIRAHAGCRTQPLRWAIGHSSLLISDSSPFSTL